MLDAVFTLEESEILEKGCTVKIGGEMSWRIPWSDKRNPIISGNKMYNYEYSCKGCGAGFGTNDFTFLIYWYWRHICMGIGNT